MKNVNRKSDELGVEVDIWTQDRYADYLDCKSEGQFLRKKYLGIDTEMLSLSLLKDLSRESCNQYRNLQFTNPHTWVQRHEENNLFSGLRANQYRTIFLVGDSGYGKSSFSFRLLESYLDEGGMGIYMPDDVAKNAITLSDALEQMLSKLSPTLQRGESKKIPELLPIDRPFVIIIDDISRLNNSEMILQKVAGWAGSPYVIICPVLSRFRRVVDEIKRLKVVHIVNLDKMTFDETKQAIELVALENEISLSNIDRENLAIGVNNDPWLIGEFSKQLEAGLDPNNCVVKSIMESIDRRIDQIVEATPSLIKSACFDVLISLGLFMLEYRDFRPNYDTITDWFDEEKVETIKLLCHLNKLCSISDEGLFHFQHDRFLVYFCIQSIGKNFEKLAFNTDLISEPYYAEFIAQALIQFQQPSNILEKIIEENPLAIIITMRFIGENITDYHKELFHLANRWIKINANNHSTSAPEYLRGEIAYSLIRTDSSLVLDLPETNYGLQKNWLGWFARLRNGDAKGAIEYCKIFGMGLDQEGWLFLELMEHSKTHNLERLLQTFEEQLKSESEIKEIRARLIVAGFIGHNSLQNQINGYWTSISKKDEVLLEAIWAALRCSSNHLQDQFLCSLINEWSKTPDQDTFRFNYLCNLLNFYAEESIVNFLITKGDEHISLRTQIAQICGKIDLPKALEHAIRICAQADVHDRLSFSVMLWGNRKSPTLSNECIIHLRKLWNDNNNCSVRELAFSIWLNNHHLDGNSLLKIVSEISPDEPFFNDAIRERARLGDQSCVPHLVNILIEDPSYFHVAHSVWCKDVELVAKKYLAGFSSIPNDFSGGMLDTHYHLAYLIRDIPDEVAEAFLLEYWYCLQFSPLFIQAAIYTGTQKCIEMAEKSIKRCPDKTNLFKYIDQFFGVLGYGSAALLPPSRLPSIEFRRIKNVEPFVEYLDESSLNSFAAVCYLLGNDAIDWCKENFPKEINDHFRRGLCATKDDVIGLLENLYHKYPYFIYDLLEKLEKFGYSQDEIMGFLQEWMQEDINFEKLKIIAEFIIQIGKRKHLGMLDVPPLDIPIYQKMFEDIKKNTEYAVKRRTLE
jgi:hypothetical protein